MAYKYGRFQQPEIGSGYSYGGGEPNYVNPDGIAAANARRNATYEAQRNLWAQNNANSMALRDQQAAYEWRQKADRENQRQRNVMGISPLEEQALDEYSPMYQTTNQYGQTAEQLGLKPVMTIGDESGSAPADIPKEQNPFIGMGPLKRTLKPGMEQIRNDALTDRATAPYDNPLRQREADVKEIGVLTNALENMEEDDPNYGPTQQRLSALIAKQTVNNAPGGQASGYSALGTGMNNMIQAVVPGISPLLSYGRTSQTAPAPATPTPTPATAATPMPTPTPTPAPQGEIQMDVTTDQMIKSDPTGSIVRGQDGRIYFLPKGTQNRIDITDRYRG